MNMLKNHVFGSFNLNISEKYRLSFEDIFLRTLDTYTKKMNPPSIVFWGGVHGKVCWLIAKLRLLLRNGVLKFIHSCLNSNNLISKTTSISAITTHRSQFGENYRYICYKYKIPRYLLFLPIGNIL